MPNEIDPMLDELGVALARMTASTYWRKSAL